MSEYIQDKIRRDIDQRLKEMQEETEIRCPYCKTLQSNDDGQYPVNYWDDGSESSVDMVCENDLCEKTFHVEEKVSRTYEVTSITQAGEKMR